jgi:hypothetical protein
MASSKHSRIGSLRDRRDGADFAASLPQTKGERGQAPLQ